MTSWIYSMNPFFWQGPPNIFVCHIHATTTFYAVTSTNLASYSIHLILVSRIGMVWLDDFCPRVEILFVVVYLGGYISKGPNFFLQILSKGWMIKMLIFELCYSAFIDGCAVTFGVSQSSGAVHPNIVWVPTALGSTSGGTEPGTARIPRRAFPNVCFASIARPVTC